MGPGPICAAVGESERESVCEALALSRQLVGAGCVAGLGLCGSGLCGAGVWAASVSAECREPYRAAVYGPSNVSPS